MDPLATVADMEARGVTVTAEEQTAVDTFLATASAVVRDAAGSPISETTTTTDLPGDIERRLRLPGLPVQSVTVVELDGVEVNDWRLSGANLWRRAGWAGSAYEPSTVTVTYVHGLATVPADIVDLVCRLAARSLVALRGGDGASGLAQRPVTQERIGDWSAMYGNSDPEFTDMTLTQREADKLSSRFGGGARVVKMR